VPEHEEAVRLGSDVAIQNFHHAFEVRMIPGDRLADLVENTQRAHEITLHAAEETLLCKSE
jgi:glutamate racemase